MSAREQNAVEDALVAGLVMLVAAMTFLMALMGLSRIAMLVLDRDPALPVGASLVIVLAVVVSSAVIAITARRATRGSPNGSVTSGHLRAGAARWG